MLLSRPESLLLLKLNIATPLVTSTTWAHLTQLSRFPNKKTFARSTGTSLHDLPMTCVG